MADTTGEGIHVSYREETSGGTMGRMGEGGGAPNHAQAYFHSLGGCRPPVTLQHDAGLRNTTLTAVGECR